MRTPIQAMLWELWRTSRWELLVRISFYCCFILLMSRLKGGMDTSVGSGEGEVLRGLVMLMLIAGSMFSMTWLTALDNHQTGFSYRLGFARPVSTTILVLIPMLFVISAAVVSFMIPAALFAAFTGISIPLLALAPIVGSLVSCYAAATWAPTTMVGKWTALIAVVVASTSSYAVFHIQRNDPEPWILAMGKAGYFVLPWHYYLMFSVASLIAFAATVIGVDRQRHGDDWEISNVFGAGVRRRLARSKAHATKPFANRFTAQCWFEMRRFGNKMLFIAALVSLIVFGFVCVGSWLYPGRDTAPVVWLGSLLIFPLVNQLIGADGAGGLRCKHGSTSLPAFDATRSLPNDLLITIKLFVIAACSLVGMLLMATAATVHSALVGNWSTWAMLAKTLLALGSDVNVLWLSVGLSTAALFYFGWGSMQLAFVLWVAIYPGRYLAAIIIGILHIALAVWDAENGWVLQRLWTAEGYIVAVAIFFGCILALRKALISGYLGRHLFAGALCLWLVYISSSIGLYFRFVPGGAIHPAVLALGVSMLFVPLAATAAAPLALASHRHR